MPSNVASSFFLTVELERWPEEPLLLYRLERSGREIQGSSSTILGEWAHAKTPRRKEEKEREGWLFFTFKVQSWRLGVLSEAGVRFKNLPPRFRRTGSREDVIAPTRHRVHREEDRIP